MNASSNESKTTELTFVDKGDNFNDVVDDEVIVVIVQKDLKRQRGA
jgi:hypothetical protein